MKKFSHSPEFSHIFQIRDTDLLKLEMEDKQVSERSILIETEWMSVPPTSLKPVTHTLNIS